MPSRDIQAQIHIIQTQLQAIKSDPAETRQQADSIEQALGAIRARCENIRDHVAAPSITSDAALAPASLGPPPEMADVPRPAI